MTDQTVGSYADVQPPKPTVIPVPDSVQRKMTRGRTRMKRNANKRRLCVRFERGDTFSYLDAGGDLQTKALASNPRSRTGKPPHRIRNRYNFIRPIVEDKVSAATQRVPGYEVDPSTADPEAEAAAKLSQKVLNWGYDRWGIRKATVDAVKTAIGLGGSSFALPYFDPNVGPYTHVDGKWVGQGEIRVKVFGGNEVYWEPGVDFDLSPWWCTEQALPVDQIKEMPGYCGGPIVANASTADIPNDSTPEQNQAIVTDYYERPCPKWPRGRWLTVSNGRVIIDGRLIDPTAEYPWQDYPLQDAEHQVLDEPLLLRLVYTHDPDDDDDLGLTWQLIDFERSAQDCLNKMMEYKNRGLNLQMLAPVNSIIDRPDDVPGTIKYFKVGPNGEKPEWERAPDANILSALIQIFNIVVQQMKDVASYEDVHADPNVGAKTTAAVIEQSIARWQSFLGDLAQWHSTIGRHGLLLSARYYTEPRLIQIRGRQGWESIDDFRGSNIKGQTNVRVPPGSLEYLNRQQVTSRVQYYASMGWVTGQQAMRAIEGGQVDALTESYDEDIARVNRIIQRIRNNTIMDMPTRIEKVPAIDPMTGGPAIGPDGQPATRDEEVPAWMPDEQDSVPVWKEQLALWMKSDDYERSPREAQLVAKLMWGDLKEHEKQLATEQAQQQMAQAQSMGMTNAAAPQGPPSLPSTPNATGPGPEPAQPQQ